MGLRVGTICWAVLVAGTAPELERFDGVIPRAQLEHVLSRAVTMAGLLHEHGDVDDQIRFLKHTGARFAGRTLLLWGGEENLVGLLSTARSRERKIHAALPELWLQAAVFEIVSEEVEKHAVPPWVSSEFGVPHRARNFSYNDMLYPDGRYKNHWRRGASVPDMSRTETQMWFYFLARQYIDVGVEAIHFGQVELMGRNDREYGAWEKMLARVRAYGRAQARRGMVLCDAHVPRGGVRVGERLLFDFHSFPMRIDEVPERPMEGVLRTGYLDGIYGRSLGGVTPSGWRCEHLPYLVELDNFGRSGKEGQNIGGHWIWGYDEITWFAHLSQPAREAWLRYAWKWVRENDPNGYLQMPGSRNLAVPVEGKDWYWASRKSAACPDGFGDEETIREIWR